MAAGKWIGGFLGFVTQGPLGALIGFALGWLFDKGINDVNTDNSYNNREYDDYDHTRRQQEGQRNSFLFSLLVLAAYVVRADGRVMHSEMETVRRFLRNNFGEAAVNEGEDIMLRLFEHQKSTTAAEYSDTIRNVCRQISLNMNYSVRLQLVDFLVEIARADGVVKQEEVAVLREISTALGIPKAEIDSMLNLNDAATNLDAAYKVLGITPSASDDEVKAAYRRMALQHHPDRVATLGDDIRSAAEKKFQEINSAKELIYKARGL